MGVANVNHHQRKRGIALLLSIFVVAIVLAVALAVLGHAINSATSTSGVQMKNGAFDAAEAGLNQAIFALDVDKTLAPGTCPTPGGTLDGVSFNCVIGANQLNSTVGTSVTDPGAAGGSTVSVPAGNAFVYGYVSSMNGRRTYVEAVVTRATPAPLPATGVNAQANVFYAYNPNVTITGNVHANVGIYWNQVGKNPNPPPVTGATYGYLVNQLPASKGMYTGGSGLITLPTAAQMNLFKADALQVAQSGASKNGSQAITDCAGNDATGGCTGNVYISGDVNLTSSIAFRGGGTVFIDGNVNISGQGQFFNVGNGTIVVEGALSTSGQGAYANNSDTGQIIVFAKDAPTCQPPAQPFPSEPTGCAISLTGISRPSGLIYAPFGSVLVAGNGNELGAIDAGTSPSAGGGSVYFFGGGSSGGFTAVPVPTAPVDGEVKITAYWEY